MSLFVYVASVMPSSTVVWIGEGMGMLVAHSFMSKILKESFPGCQELEFTQMPEENFSF